LIDLVISRTSHQRLDPSHTPRDMAIRVGHAKRSAASSENNHAIHGLIVHGTRISMWSLSVAPDSVAPPASAGSEAVRVAVRVTLL
jgi:hypothetical protein